MNKPISQEKGTFIFENPQWWLSQLNVLADGWLQVGEIGKRKGDKERININF
jgi:hypothetical protein